MNLVTEDFEGAFPGSTWTLHGDPTWGKDSYRPYSGSWSGYCAGGGMGGVSPPGLYPHNMNAWMVRGPFDLTNANDAELLFYHWTKNQESGNGSFWAVASTDLENWVGYQWQGDCVDQCNGFCHHTYDLTNVSSLGSLCGQSEVWIAVGFRSDGSISDEGTYLDDVSLRAAVGECPGAAEMVYITKEDDENNSHTGTADGDMYSANPECIYNNDDKPGRLAEPNPLAPIEFDIVVPTLPIFRHRAA